MMRAGFDVLYRRVAKLWQAGGRTSGTINGYLHWVRRFRDHFGAAGDGEMLTRDRVDAFAARYVELRMCAPDTARQSARCALRAWSCALRVLGFEVPQWVEPASPRRLSPMLAQFAEYRLRHGGVSPSTVPEDVRYASAFITFLRKRGRRPDAARIIDIDEFVAARCSRMTRHSCAVALLQAGIDVTVIRDYLGHASVTTTSRYVTSNLKMKRDVLDAFWKRAGLVRVGRSPWRPKPELLRFLASP